MRADQFLVLCVCAVLLLSGAGAEEAADIGRLIFQDRSLSEPKGQACITCHDPAFAFADPRPVSPGAVPGKTGIRNAPTLMYAALIPPRVFEEILTEDGVLHYGWEGGLFHDGRADDTFEQVQQPFFDAHEMNLPDEAELVARLRSSDYAQRLKNWVGPSNWQDDARLAYHAYRSLMEFLKEPLFRPFDARIDDYLAGDENALKPNEKRGLVVFNEMGKCADCHFLKPHSWEQALLSDYGYDNLGVPSLKGAEKDPGLGAVTKNDEELGQFRAPSLRNVTLTAPYMHNGSIATLREVMEFYNRRDLEPERWQPTDYPETVNHEDLGNLELTDEQVDDLTALMDAFTDRCLLDKKSEDLFPTPPAGVAKTKTKRIYFPDWTYRLHPAFPGVGD